MNSYDVRLKLTFIHDMDVYDVGGSVVSILQSMLSYLPGRFIHKVNRRYPVANTHLVRVLYYDCYYVIDRQNQIVYLESLAPTVSDH